MMNGINTFNVDGQVVIHTAVTFHIRQLGKLQTALPAFRPDIYQTDIEASGRASLDDLLSLLRDTAHHPD